MKYIIKFFVSGIFCSLLFPPFFLYPLGFIIFPFFYFILIERKYKKLSKFKQFLNGFFFGFGLNLIVLYWLREPFSFNVSTTNFSFLAFLLNFYISIYFGFSFLFLSFFKHNFSKLILIPVIFVIAEIVRENFLFGFPWISFAVVASSNEYLLQIAYFIGTNGLSYLIILLYFVPISIFYLADKKINFFHKINLSLIFSFLFILLFLTFIRLLIFKDQNTSHEINFSLNQLNISQYDKINNPSKLNNLQEILKILDDQNNTISIFSETDYTKIIKNNDIVDFFQKNLKNNNSLIIGGIREENNKYYNSLYFITEDHFQFFDKKILVPFGEFLPFRNKLSFLEPIVGKFDFEKGKKDRIIQTKNNFNFIPVICYEVIFFNDLLSSMNLNSPLLINITNDAWFGNYSGPYQHFYLSRIRSAEYNKFLIRVSNNGVSGIIDNYGKIIDYIPLNSNGKKSFQIKIPNLLNNIVKLHQLIYLFFIIVIFIAIRVEKRFA